MIQRALLRLGAFLYSVMDVKLPKYFGSGTIKWHTVANLPQSFHRKVLLQRLCPLTECLDRRSQTRIWTFDAVFIKASRALYAHSRIDHLRRREHHCCRSRLRSSALDSWMFQ